MYALGVTEKPDLRVNPVPSMATRQEKATFSIKVSRMIGRAS